MKNFNVGDKVKIIKTGRKGTILKYVVPGQYIIRFDIPDNSDSSIDYIPFYGSELSLDKIYIDYDAPEYKCDNCKRGLVKKLIGEIEKLIEEGKYNYCCEKKEPPEPKTITLTEAFVDRKITLEVDRITKLQLAYSNKNILVIGYKIYGIANGGTIAILVNESIEKVKELIERMDPEEVIT